MTNEPDTVNLESMESSSIEDSAKKGGDDPVVGNIAAFVHERFSRAKDSKYSDEERALTAYTNYRGIYNESVVFNATEKSRVFIKVTKTKVQAAYGQICDVLLGNNKFPLTVDPTVLPEGVDEAIHFESSTPSVNPSTGQPVPVQEMPPLAPGETKSVYDRLTSSVKSFLDPVKSKLQVGEGRTATSVTIHPAMIAAKKMEKKIHDSLEESNATKELRLFAFDMSLYGTGIFEGPYVVEKEYPNWNEEGDYEPTFKKKPVCSHVSFWDFYPDPDATNMGNCEFTVRRHKLSRSKMLALKTRPYFRSMSIDNAIESGTNYDEQWWERDLEDNDNKSGEIERYEVLEYWGFASTKTLSEDYELEIPADLKDEEQLNMNIWVCNGEVLRLVMNPFKPAYIPYYACPYEPNPNSFFGIGVAENMDDTQTLMNGFMRMGVDNAALSGNLVIEVDETNLIPGQDMDIYPGKKFRRQGGAPGQAIFGTQFPNVTAQNMQMFDKARQLADESTGIPSISHGQAGVSGFGRTSSGLSMVLNSAHGGTRTVIKNIDDFLIEPIGKSLFHWFMQFDFDEDIRGDMSIKARGTQSLVATEVKSQRLMQFLSIVQNPMLAPFAKFDYIMQEIAVSLDLDPEKVTNSLADAAIQAEIMKGLAPDVPDSSQDAGGPPPVSDGQGSGNGNIGVGSVPQAGEEGFSGNVS